VPSERPASPPYLDPAPGGERSAPEWLSEAVYSDVLDGKPRRLSRGLRRRLTSIVLAAAAFGAGISANALFFQVGHKGQSTRVVIGQQVVKPNPPAHHPAQPRTTPTSIPAVSMGWGAPVPFDAGYAPQSVSCPTTTFCASVDNAGRAVLYQGGIWGPPVDVDGTTQISSVSCTDPRFCAAVDQAGNAFTYNGSTWSHPAQVDKSKFPELTSVSCASPSFCAAVDGSGNALIFNGNSWSQPQQVDAPGWSPAPVSRDVATISCPSTNSCVGVDATGSAFYYTGDWQPASSINSSASPTTKYRNAVACSTNTSCVAAQNPGQIALYDGTQWSLPVDIDAANYIAAISCPSAGFCAAVDGLLPAGFGTGTESGQVFLYNGLTWSAARNIDGAGILQSISCPTKSFCVAVDQGGNAIAGTASG
jgi:hypothetical protein